MSDQQECAVSDCLRLAHSGGKHCSAHAKQAQRGGITHAPIRERMPLRERVSHLCDELANADSEDDKARARAWDALRKAIEEWAHALRQQRAGRARMLALSQEQRSALARQAATARWTMKARSRKVAKGRKIKITERADARMPARLASAPDEAPAPEPGNGRAPERG